MVNGDPAETKIEASRPDRMGVHLAVAASADTTVVGDLLVGKLLNSSQAAS